MPQPTSGPLATAAASAVLSLFAVATPTGAQPVNVDLIAIVGQPSPGETEPILTLFTPFTNGVGEVGFVGSVARPGGPDHFVWYDAGPIWFDSDALPGNFLSMATDNMGIGDSGEFIYAPDIDGDGGVWTHDGPLLAENDPVPGHPGLFSTFNNRPQMLPDGTVHWIGGLSDSPAGPTVRTALLRSSDTATPVIEIVLEGGDLVGGIPLRPTGLQEYSISDDGQHHIQAVQLDTGSNADDGAVFVDGSIVAREGEPATYAVPPAAPANWGDFGFAVVSINNAGDYLFSDDTDGPEATDNFLAYNGAIQVREGDVLDDLTLTAGSNCHTLSINDLGQAVFIWSIGGPAGPDNHLFFAPDASDLRGAVRLLSHDDPVDVDDDGIADYRVDLIRASPNLHPGLDLAEDGFVYANVELVPLGPAPGGIAIVRLTVRVPNLVVTPSPYDYGPVALGETAVQAFTVANSGIVDLEVLSTQITGPDAADFSIVSGSGPITLAPGEQVVVEIAFTPSGAGARNAAFEIASNDPNSELVVVTLVGEGTVSALEIPTLTAPGLAVLAAALLGLGWLVVRRRRLA